MIIYNDYFNSREFDSPDKPNSGINMDRAFVDKLSRARHIAEIPFIIVSGVRSKEHNHFVAGVLDSSHLVGLACDISCIDSRSRFKILYALTKVGFNRIGINKTFIHVDDDNTKPSNVCWLY